MANKEHLDILKQGVEVWNVWREENPGIRADLTEADLNGADLTGANLTGANLTEADLTGASLNGADLTGAYLNGASLNGADLTGASLSGADLLMADLNGANLIRCLVGATVFVAVDLAGCGGLEDLRVASPIYVDPQTVRNSPDLPESFLLLAEWPQEFIDSRSLLHGLPIRFHSVFISYSHEDEAVADLLYRRLRKERIDAFYAPEDLPWGARTRERIISEIHTRSRLLVVLSEKSVASDWVEDEVNTALDKEKKEGGQVLFPIMIDDTVLKSDRDWIYHLKQKRNIGDWTGWEDPSEQERLFERMLKELRDA